MAAAAGARVTLIAGPVHLPTPHGVDRIDVETAEDMAEEVRRALPVDIVGVVSNHMTYQKLVVNHDLPFHHIKVTKENKPEAEARLMDMTRNLLDPLPRFFPVD